jgi:hypothetical protein
MKTQKYPMVMELAKSAVELLIKDENMSTDLASDVALFIEELNEDGYLPREDAAEMLGLLNQLHGRPK